MDFRSLNDLHEKLKQCRKCPQMCGSPVLGPALSESQVMLIGQAPGVHESDLGRPFAFTAGKTLFKWLHSATGSSEEDLRAQIYFAAIARCFPGKASSGQGDRLPNRAEIANCREHLIAEIALIQPKLILAVGKLAISQMLLNSKYREIDSLNQLVGKKWKVQIHGLDVNVIPLPHPSGVSRWPHSPDGKKKLAMAIRLISREFKKLENPAP